MCGIAGIVGAIGPSNRAALARMSEALVHRGPDAEGTWESPPNQRGWGCLLAHRRLAILDLSPSGVQPMIDPASGDVIVLNGEIYNYRELRDDLRRSGRSFASTGDTEVMLKLVGRDGLDALNRLRGMFTCGYWESTRRRLVLARDPLGIKPLYVARNADPNGAWTIAFASEVRALLASRLLGTPRLNHDAVGSLAWNGFVVGPGSAVAGVDELAAGDVLVLDDGGAVVTSRRFRSPSHEGPPGSPEDSIVAAMEETVQLHLASDVPLSVFLSSGVDSTAVANLAQRTSSTPVHTFTLAFEESEHNEGPMAKRIAAAIGTAHHEVVLTESHFVRHLDTAVDSLDQPTMDGINSYFMSHAVRDAGFTVALVGTGADELFGGYRSFLDLPRLERWARATRWLPASVQAKLAAQLMRLRRYRQVGLGHQTRWAKLPEMLQRVDELVRMYQIAYALFLPSFHRELVGANVSPELVDGLPVATFARLTDEIDPRSALESISHLEQRVFLGQRLLRDTDAASMSASLEVRLPFVDTVFVDAVSRLPPEQRFDPVGHKALVRRVGLRDLDPALFERPKTGFVLPFERWLRSRLGTAVGETLRDPVLVAPTGLSPSAVNQLWTTFQERPGRIYWSRVWALYAFVRWCHTNQVYV